MANDGRGSLVNRHTLLLSALRDAETTKCDCAVLGAISEHADLNGACWPGVELLASKLSITGRSVMRAVKNLERLGYLEVDRSKRSNHYRIASTGDKEVTIEDEQQVTNPSPIGDKPVTSQVTNLSPHTCQPCHPNSVQELSLKNSVQEGDGSAPVKKVTRAKSKNLTLQEWLDSFEDDPTLVAALDMVERYVKKIGLPIEFENLAWEAFCARYRHDPGYKGKRYDEWPRVYRNALEGNWFKLWYTDDAGQYHLSQVGKQADLRFETGIQQMQSAHPDPAVARKLVA